MFLAMISAIYCKFAPQEAGFFFSFFHVIPLIGKQALDLEEHNWWEKEGNDHSLCACGMLYIRKLISYTGQYIQLVSFLPHLVKPGFCLTGITSQRPTSLILKKIHSSSQLRTEWAPSPSKSAPRLLSDKTVFFSVSERPPGPLSFLCLEGPKARMSLLMQNSREFYGLHKRSFCYKTFKTEFLISYSAHQSLCFFIF